MTKGNEARLIAALVEGLTLRQAAAASGMSVATVQRRKRDPQFRARVERERNAAVALTVRELAETRSAAVSRIRMLIDSTDERVALRAAISALRTSVQYEDLYDVSRRLIATEQMAAELARRELAAEAAERSDLESASGFSRDARSTREH